MNKCLRSINLASLCLLDDRDELSQVKGILAENLKMDLVVTPRLTSLVVNGERKEESLCEYIDLAKQFSTYIIVAGSLEYAGDVYIASFLINRMGELIGEYRQTHLFPDDEKFTPGEDLPVFETDFGKIGMTLGADFYFPEVYWTLGMKGADIITLQPAIERFREYSQWLPMLKSRCLDAHVHLIMAMHADPRTYITNRWNNGMQGALWGRSMVLNRVGVPIADTGYEDGVAYARVHLDKRKEDPYPYYEGENHFFVNNMGDRSAFEPLTKVIVEKRTPRYGHRKVRLVIGHIFDSDQWTSEKIPHYLLSILKNCKKQNPDIVLLSEMGARLDTISMRETCDIISEIAQEMNSYVLIGGIDTKGETSQAWLWDRKGDIVYRKQIYWPKGYPKIDVYDTDFGRIGIHLCGDVYIGELDRVMALQGAELILDPSKMWGADGHCNEMMLRARAIDNGCWIACAHFNTSDPGNRSVVIDPYGQVLGSSAFQEDGSFLVEIDLNQSKVYYEGLKKEQPVKSKDPIESYFLENLPNQVIGWRKMISSRRRPDLYSILPEVNEITKRYRPKVDPKTGRKT